MIIIKINRHNQLFFDAIKEDPACVAEPLKGHFELLKKLKDGLERFVKPENRWKSILMQQIDE